MFRRFKSAAEAIGEGQDRLDRFREQQRRLIINSSTAKQTLRHGLRFIKRGQSCAIIVKSKDSIDIVMNMFSSLKHMIDINIIQIKEDSILFENGTELRVLPESNKLLATSMLGESVKIINAQDGDPKMKKFRQIIDQ